MPEYLAPGVYLEESDAGVNPIPGVSTSTIDIETAQALVAAIESIIERTQPNWTRSNDADPGVTLIELFAWVAESLLFRSGGYYEWITSAKSIGATTASCTDPGSCAASGCKSTRSLAQIAIASSSTPAMRSIATERR